VLCVLLLAVAAFVIAFAVSESFRDKCLGFWRARRGDKGLSWQVSSAHFAQAFSMGVSSGMQIEEAVELSGKLLEGVPGAQKKCSDCLDLLSQGTAVSDALLETNLLPQAECRILKTAVRSGTTDTCINEIADRMSWKSERAIQQAVSRIEPTLVIVGCLLVGLILFSVMLPLMNIMSSMG
jgi:type IV pilus assembly protein PilC